jgi:Asp-tRNA(Asn)/Glu-tRNA(Gln) amidotransferase A subunit family amidase
VPEYSPGGSTGGEAALLAQGGRIGIGSDVAGSVRVPAAWSGIYSLRCSTGRWPKGGVNTSMPGQEGVPSVFSPMARTLDDLTYFTRAIIRMEPWKYEHSVHPISWRSDVESEAQNKPLRIGLMTSDGMYHRPNLATPPNESQSFTNHQASSPRLQPLSAPSQQPWPPSPKPATPSQKSPPHPTQTPLQV